MSEQELMPVSKTKSSTIFLFPVNFTSKFKFKDKTKQCVGSVSLTKVAVQSSVSVDCK